MSKTARVGSAAATECGISTEVIAPPALRQAEVDVLAGDRDLLVVAVAGVGEPGEDGLAELLGGPRRGRSDRRSRGR